MALRKITITLLFGAGLLVSCRELPLRPADDGTVARVGRKELRVSDIEAIAPKNGTAADSLQFVEMYIDRWIIKQLKVEQAELLFPSSADDIEAQVEEYRQSLLIRKIEQYYLDGGESDEITDAQIEAYYNSHKADFRLDHTVVKGTVVAFAENFRQKDRLLEAMRSPKPEAQQSVRDMCEKNNFPCYEMSEWTDFGTFLALLPTVRSRNYDSLTDESGVQKMNADGIQYYFRITSALKKGEPQPLDMARETIVHILETQRRGEIIRSHETEMLETAIGNGHARIYTNKKD